MVFAHISPDDVEDSKCAFTEILSICRNMSHAAGKSTLIDVLSLYCPNIENADEYCELIAGVLKKAIIEFHRLHPQKRTEN